MTLTGCILLPLLNLRIPFESSGIKGVYLGDKNYEDSWGNYIYLLIDANNASVETLKQNNLYIDYYYPSPTEIMLIYKITNEDKLSIVRPFLEGKYSTIPKDYVDRNFTKFLNGNLNTTYAILTKAVYIKKFWEERGIDIGDNEVCSKPKKGLEIYGYEEDSDYSPYYFTNEHI